MQTNYLNQPSSSRLSYRPLTEADIPLWTTFLSNEACTRYFPAYMKSGGDKHATTWIQKQMERYRDGHFGLLALIEIASCNMVGQCGLLTQIVDGSPELEIGYHLLPQFQGKGYVTEAAQHFKNYAFEHQLADSIVSIIHVDNILSIKVAERNGMKPDKRTVFGGIEVVVYRIVFNV